MILTTATKILNDAFVAGLSEEDAIMKAHNFLKGVDIPQSHFEAAMDEVRSVASRIYGSEQPL